MVIYSVPCAKIPYVWLLEAPAPKFPEIWEQKLFFRALPWEIRFPQHLYLLSHTQLSVSNVNFNWGVCEGQEDDAGRDCGQALDRDGTRGTEIHATNSEKGPTPCFS